MATLLGTGIKNANNTTAIPVSITGTFTVGKAYFATIGGNVVSSLDATFSATDSLGNTWVKADSQVNGTSCQVSQFYMVCTTGGANPTVTFTPTNSVGRVVAIVEDPNVTLTGSPPLDTHPKGTGSNASVTAGSTGTLAQASEYAYVSSCFASGSTASSVDSSFTLQGTGVSTNGATDKRVQSADRTVSATTALSPTISLSTANAWAVVVGTYKLAAAGTNGSVTAVVATATTAGSAPVVSGGATVTAVAATVSAAAAAPVVTGVRNAAVTAVVATASTAAVAPTVSGSANVTAAAATVSVAALAPVVSTAGNGNVAAIKATVTAAAVAPTVTATRSATVAPPSAAIAVQAAAPVVSAGSTVGAPTASITVAAIAPQVSVSGSVAAPVATVSLQALVPTISGSAVVLAPPATVTVQAATPVVKAFIPRDVWLDGELEPVPYGAEVLASRYSVLTEQSRYAAFAEEDP